MGTKKSYGCGLGLAHGHNTLRETKMCKEAHRAGWQAALEAAAQVAEITWDQEGCAAHILTLEPPEHE